MNNSMTETVTKASNEMTITNKKSLIHRFENVRRFTEKLCEPLETDDFVIQSMPDVSPTKWHLGHTSWFFEAFVLQKALKSYKSPHSLYTYLFNSYYVQIGERWFREQRGLLSRPTVKDIFVYRKFVEDNVKEFLESCDEKQFNDYAPIIEIGLNHEQQHQELLLTDLKHVLSINPLNPVYSKREAEGDKKIKPITWIEYEGGLFEIGNSGNEFCYDNESPRHKEYVQPFLIADRLVTNGEYIEFIESDGYQNTPLWLSNGWTTVEEKEWKAPFYWEKKDGEWWNFTLNGFKKVNPDEPVCHVSYFEADAYATWKDARLPTEAEWELAVNEIPCEGNFVENENYHPIPVHKTDDNGLQQVFGDVWEWTGSSYLPYPGFKPLPGALGEYNGKFMSGQMVLRGGSCATSKSHIRKTYRNFFYPPDRWQFMGFRLVKDVN